MKHLENLHLEKWFYAHFPERANALLNDNQLQRVWRKFGPDVFRRSSVLEGFADFVRANGFKGDRCVEIGTCHGLTAILLARNFQHVVSIDVAPSEHKQAIADFLRVKNITFIDVKDNAEKAAVIKDLEFDGAFCDGDHARDTESDFALLERCGQVLLHENWEPQPPVQELVRRLRAGPGTVAAAGKWALWRWAEV